jgi:hypothetical protein
METACARKESFAARFFRRPVVQDNEIQLIKKSEVVSCNSSTRSGSTSSTPTDDNRPLSLALHAR